MTIAEIYAEYTPGSDGFAIAVRDHCGFDMSREEIKRLGAVANSAEEFEDQWKNDDWWADEKQ